jgi:hypothetical protein
MKRGGRSKDKLVKLLFILLLLPLPLPLLSANNISYRTLIIEDVGAGTGELVR